MTTSGRNPKTLPKMLRCARLGVSKLLLTCLLASVCSAWGQVVAPPTNLTATIVNVCQVQLTWTPSVSTGANGTHLMRDGVNIAILPSVMTTWVDDQATPATHVYTAATPTATGDSVATSPISIDVPACPTDTTTTTQPASTTSTLPPASSTTTSSTTITTTSSTSSSTTSTTVVSSTTTTLVDTTKPTVPTGLVGIVVNCATVNLTWNASTDASGIANYKVYKWNGSLGRWDFYKTSATTTAQAYPLGALSTYYFSVSAVDNAGNESALSSWITASTPAC